LVASDPCVMTRLDDIGVSSDEVDLGTVVMLPRVPASSPPTH